MGKVSLPTRPESKLKCPEIPLLQCYRTPPAESFWDKFPKNDLPDKVVTHIKVEALAKELQKASPFLLLSEKFRGHKTIFFLGHGFPSYQKCQLPALSCENAESAFEFGKEMTDTLGQWTKAGFVSGPFKEPPVKNFRVNTLMMIPQTDKVRPVLNVSLPKGRSFNDNICEEKLEKVFCPQQDSLAIRLLRQEKAHS